MTSRCKSFIELHIAVFLFGFTAILGEVILLHPLVLTWWRVILASLFFIFAPKYIRRAIQIPRRLIIIYAGIGGLVALHWLTFYASVKASNASITLVCLATTTFFTAIIEPIVMRQRFSPLQLGLGILILPGMALIVEATPGHYAWGIVLGTLSALLAATFGALNKRWMGDQDPLAITFIEMTAAALFLSCSLPLFVQQYSWADIQPSWMDWIYLGILAVVCTNIAYLLALRALRSLSAFTTALTINLEPIYGIIFAAVLLNQYKDLNVRFYLGASIILLSVVCYPALSKWLLRFK